MEAASDLSKRSLADTSSRDNLGASDLSRPLEGEEEGEIFKSESFLEDFETAAMMLALLKVLGSFDPLTAASALRWLRSSALASSKDATVAGSNLPTMVPFGKIVSHAKVLVKGSRSLPVPPIEQRRLSGIATLLVENTFGLTDRMPSW